VITSLWAVHPSKANGLEEGKLISRRRNPDDRRRHIVEVTNKGRKALERAERGIAGLEQGLLGSLSQSGRLTLKGNYPFTGEVALEWLGMASPGLARLPALGAAAR
jgi:hypothetical protein